MRWKTTIRLSTDQDQLAEPVKPLADAVLSFLRLFPADEPSFLLFWEGEGELDDFPAPVFFPAA